MAYNPDAVVTVAALKAAMNRTKNEIVEAVESSDHLRRTIVKTLPEPSEANENVQYLFKNQETGFYDIYMLIDGEVVQIDDTNVDLEGYITQEELNQALAGLGTGSGAVATDEEVAEILDEVFGTKEEVPAE